MRTQTLNRHNNFNGFAKGSHVKGHLNGVMIVLTMSENYNYPAFMEFIDSTRLKVKYVEDRVRTLVPSVPIHNFIDITNAKYGSTNEVGMQSDYFQKALIASMDDSDSFTDSETFDIVKGINASLTNQGNSQQIQFYVDLGSIYVDGGNELHYELTSTSTNTTMDVEVFALSIENEPSHFIEYDMDSDRNELHQNVVSSYLCTPSGAKGFENVEITIDSTSVQYESNTKGLLACSSLFSKVENVALGRTLPVFEALNSVPEDVQVKYMSTEDISGYYILNVRMDATYKGYIDGKRKAITEKAEVLSRLEFTKPALAEVLQAEGLPTSTELKERVL